MYIAHTRCFLLQISVSWFVAALGLRNKVDSSATVPCPPWATAAWPVAARIWLKTGTNTSGAATTITKISMVVVDKPPAFTLAAVGAGVFAAAAAAAASEAACCAA